ncbi:hypothetical protein [Cellvibrio sp. QJXJ]|uniref:hypothetical protein n=1 Tax=Cellvibrio sp. QJXJ TaxID=2964606 RepID=UPI0021C2561A|nr:hypothetical protein [Cellvibrio sp. QJXJ]UUA73115.1 hypothetical protein NNX04_01380 [Cellvibrio sp. QJXJ]
MSMGQENQPEAGKVQSENNKEGMSASTKWAIGVTAVWLGGVAIYVFCNWCAFVKMEPNAVGDFLAGTMSPLALFWLVAGYRQQGEELRLNTEALKAQLTELALQVEATKELGDSNLLQANVAKSMHDFNVFETNRVIEEKRLERLRILRPDIYLTFVNQSNSQWVISAENIGGDAYRIQIDSEMFRRSVLFADSSKFTRDSKHRIELLDQLPECGDSILSLNCWDADDNHYVFHYRYEASRNLILSAHPYENGILVDCHEPRGDE